jgi:hypothetical protein
MELFEASAQWCTRPVDERFASLAEMHTVCSSYRLNSRTRNLNTNAFHAVVNRAEVGLDLNSEYVRLTHWAFGQLCNQAGAPASYLRELPAEKAADLIQYGLSKAKHDEVQTLFYQPPEQTPLIRCVSTLAYKRIWNADVTHRLLQLPGYWRVPPARPAFSNQPGTRLATENDVLNDAAFSLSIQVGDLIAPAGLYASDHDMFAFMVDPTKQIEDGSGEPLFRGFFVSNAEVVGTACKITTFLYRHCCGNHICWGTTGVKSYKIRHIGAAEYVFEYDFEDQLNRYANLATENDRKLISSAKQLVLGDSQEEVIQTLQSKRIKLGKRFLYDAYDEAELHDDEDGDPKTVWGMVNGITRMSQLKPYCDFADQRNAIDQESGKVLALAA